MSHLAKYRWIRPLSVAAALAIPAIVMAATVQFSPGSRLTADLLNQLSARTLDKTLVYVGTAVQTSLDPGEGSSAEAACEEEEDILLNCSCHAASPNTRTLDVRTIEVRGNDSATVRSTCRCNGINDAATAQVLIATPTCIDLPSP